jgi:hypothetical protein
LAVGARQARIAGLLALPYLRGAEFGMRFLAGSLEGETGPEAQLLRVVPLGLLELRDGHPGVRAQPRQLLGCVAADPGVGMVKSFLEEASRRGGRALVEDVLLKRTPSRINVLRVFCFRPPPGFSMSSPPLLVDP